MASEASAAALQMRADLAAGRMSMSEYARQARAAGETIGAVAAVLKEHAASAKPTATQAEAAGPAEASAAETIPAGTYFGRTHGGPVHVVDGIYLPVVSAAGDAPPAEGSVEASLAWLRAQGGWGARAAERLGPDNDFLLDLDLSDTSGGGKVAGGKIGPEAAMHVARALADNRVLTSLNLGDNALGAEGAHHLARALTTNLLLTEVVLSGNGLDDASKAVLTSAWGDRVPAGLQLD